MAPNVRLALQNIQSLPNKMPEVEGFIAAHNIDVLVLTETHLLTSFTNNDLEIPGFSLFRRDRVGKKCGGVAIFCRPDLRPRAFAIDVDLEILRVDITFSGQCIHLYAVYSPNFTSVKNVSLLTSLIFFYSLYLWRIGKTLFFSVTLILTVWFRTVTMILFTQFFETLDSYK